MPKKPIKKTVAWQPRGSPHAPIISAQNLSPAMARKLTRAMVKASKRLGITPPRMAEIDQHTVAKPSKASITVNHNPNFAPNYDMIFRNKSKRQKP